jgi:NADPH-dependent 7-cyano-7-deazaguanine reductase QueF-like protein
MRLKTTLFVFFGFCLNSIFAQQTIESTISGGDWSNPLTWVGSVVPATNDDVIINGAVTVLGTMTCNNLSVSSGASVVNGSSATTYFYVNGTFTNNGSLINDVNGWSFYVYIQGNIINNGTWRTTQTFLTSTLTQSISCGLQNYFEPTSYISVENNTTTIQVNSDLYFKNRFLLNGANLEMNQHSFYLSGSARFENGFVNSSKHIYFQNGATLGAQGHNLKLIGDSIYLHYVARLGEMTFQGVVSVQDTLINITSQTTNLYVDGDLINNGKILNNENGWAFYLNVSRDLHNYGIWKTNETNLYGIGEQHLFCGTENYFEPSSWLKITGTPTLIQSNTNLYLKSRFLVNTQSISLAENNVFLSNNGRFENGTINDSKHIYFQNGAYLGAQGINLTVVGDSVYLHHVARVGEMTLQGVISVEDTLINISSQTTNLYVEGDLINNGKIINNENSWAFYLHVSKDLHNYGIWKTNETNLNGSASQSIYCGTDNYFEPNSWLKITGTPSLVQANTSLYLKSKFLLNTQAIQLNENELYFSDNGKFENGTVNTTKHVFFQNGATLGAQAINLTVVGDTISLHNIARVGEMTFQGVVFVEDTLINITSQTTNLYVEGDLINNGKIINNENSWAFYLHVSKDLHNYGIWKTNETNLSGTGTQSIYCGTDNYFEPNSWLKITGTPSLVQANTALYLKSKFLLNSQAIQLNEKDLYLSFSGKFETGTVNTTKRIYFQNGSTLGAQGINLTVVGDSISLHNIARVGEMTFQGVVSVQDTLINISSQTTNLFVNGDLINNGKILNNESGWAFYLHISKDIHNYGVWKTNETNLNGIGAQNIYCGTDNYFEPVSWMKVSGTPSLLQLNTNLYLKSRFLLNADSILVTSKDIYLSGNGRFENGKVQAAKHIYFDAGAFLGASGHNLILEGDSIIFHQNAQLGEMTINGVVSVLENLFNINSQTTTLTINGNLHNYGLIERNANGWSFYLNVNGSFTNLGGFTPSTLSLSGSLENLGSFDISTVTLYSDNERNIKGTSISATNYYFQDSVKLVGNNVIPRLTQLPADPLALLSVLPNASIEFIERQAPSQLVNKGKVFWTQDIVGTSSSAYNFYKSTAKNRVGTSITQLTIEGLEGTLPPGITNSMTQYWRLLNNPRNYQDTLVELNLFYNINELNNNIQADLKVFFSNDGGLTWKKINENVTHDEAQSKFTFTTVASTGIYALASSELGISIIRPKITYIETNSGGNIGQVSPKIYGQSLTANAQVRLQNGATIIEADTVFVQDEIGEVLSVAFTFASETPGLFDVVVEIPGDTTMILAQAFDLQASTGAKPNVFLSGRERVLVNRWQTYTVTYSNIGNIDAKAVPLFIAVSERPGLEIEFLDFEIENPQYAYDNGYGEYVDTAAIYFISDSAFSDYSGVRVYPFYIPSIPANSVNTVKFRIKTPSSVKVQVAMQDPLFINPMNTEMAACMIGILGEGVIDITTGAIPVVGCVTAIGKNVFKTANSISTEGKKSWRSWMKDWAITFVDCGINLSGVGAVVKAVGIFTVNMKGYADAFAECKAKYNKEIDVDALTSMDPNEKAGPAGFAQENYIAYPDDISYTIFFENISSATAPAQTVHIVDTLDASVYNFESFNFGTISFDTTTLNPIKIDNSFTIYRDMRPTKDIILEIKGSFNPNNGVLTWDFTSLDPMELTLTEDPLAGFLNPNVESPQGEGYVQFSVQAIEGLNHNTELKNKASIVFDVNAPIVTNLYSNKLDLIAPVGQIDSHELLDDTTLVLNWSATDQGSGIREYILYVSKNGGEYLPYFTNNAETSMIFYGEIDTNYRFYIAGIDSVGNEEIAPSISDLEITFETSGLKNLGDNGFKIYPNPVDKNLNIIVSGDYGNQISYEILDTYGRRIKEENLDKFEINSIDVSGLNAGIYFINLIQGESIKSLKFIKK